MGLDYRVTPYFKITYVRILVKGRSVYNMSNSIGRKFTPFTLFKFALPSIMMMMFMSAYTIVDGIFISNLIGSNALSATNIVYPVINVAMAVGVMLATGGSAYVAKEMGEGKNKEANRHFTFIFLVEILAGVVIMVITLVFTEPICRLLGADDSIINYAVDYLRYAVIFAPACLLQAFYQSFFVTAGSPNLGLVMIIAAGITNAILDYVFMGIAGMGIMGAAIATGIGQSIPAIGGTLYFAIKRKGLCFNKILVDFKMLGKTCINGSSEMVTNISQGIVTIAFNIIMMKIIGASGVAAITILLYAQFLFNSFYYGFSLGTAPIISFQHGADNKEYLRSTCRMSRGFILAFSVIIFVVSILASRHVVRVFVSPTDSVYNLAIEGFRIFAFSFLFSGYNIFASSMFTALSDGKSSAVISFSRTFLFCFITLLVLPEVFGVMGVWLAIPVAEFATLFVSIWFSRRKKVYA